MNKEEAPFKGRKDKEMKNTKKKVFMILSLILMVVLAVVFGCILVKGPTKDQIEDPFMFRTNLGEESPYAKYYKDNGGEDEQEFEDGTIVSMPEEDTYLVEIKGNIYGENAMYLVYCDEDCKIEYINAMVAFTSRKDEMAYYHKLVTAANRIYGKGILTDEGEADELVRYEYKDDDGNVVNTLFVSPETLESEDGNTYYYVNLNIAENR